MDISKISFGENTYEDSNDWEWTRNLASTLDISPVSFGENEYQDGNGWSWERRLGSQVDVEEVDADDLGDWFSDYERRLDSKVVLGRDLASTLDISPVSFGENEYQDGNGWSWE